MNLAKKQFIKKYQKIPVIEYQNETTKRPLVSVLVMAYQQVNYIEKCLDGILMQQTKFDFEILVGEDASTDGTREICIEYAKKFSGRIKLFLHSRENNIKVYGKFTELFNFQYNVFSARGKYIAICEGDDYWTDPLKLQKQVDFLESNNDYGMVYSDITMTDENGYEIKTTASYEKMISRYQSGSIFWELINHNFINSLTVCVRKNLLLDYFSNFDDIFFDYRLWLHIASYSKILYVDEKWATYRIHDLGISRSKGFGDRRVPLVRQSALINYLSMINYNPDLINEKILIKITRSIYNNKYLTKKEKEPIVMLFKKHPIYFILLMKWGMNKLFQRKRSE